MERFDKEAYGFLKDHSDLVVFRGEPNSQRTKYLFRVEGVRRYPVREWGIILGDAVHCFRSMLDQLVYTFAKEPSPQTAFPICLTEKEWATRAPAQHWSVDDGINRLLDHVQPYHRSDPAAHPLAILRALSNLDKHRGIPNITLVPDVAKAKVRSTTGIREWRSFTFKEVAYEKGAVVAECKIVPEDSHAELQMDVEITATLDVAFGEILASPSVRLRGVEEVLEEIALYISDKILGIVASAWDESVRETGAIDVEKLEWM